MCIKNYTLETIEPITPAIERYSPGAMESLATVIGMRQRWEVREQAEAYATAEGRGEVQYIDIERAKKVCG